MNGSAYYCNPANFIKIDHQLFFILINILTSSFLFYYPTTIFSPIDPVPEVYPLTPDAAREIGISSKSITVETGIYIENFHEFDLTNGNFIITALVWFKFDPSIISLDTISQFSFDKGDILSISKPDTKFIDKLLFAQYRIKLKFTTNLNHKSFPLNKHRIYLILTSKSISPKEVTFSSSESEFGLSPNMVIAGWQNIGHAVTIGYTRAQLERHDAKTTSYNPVVVFSIDFVRSGMRQIFVLILPLFFVFFLALITLSLDPEQFFAMRISSSIANISALIGYRFIIENIAPKVGYFLLSDHIFNLFLALVFMIFFFHIATIKGVSEYARGIFLVILHILFLLSLYYLLIYWIN